MDKIYQKTDKEVTENKIHYICENTQEANDTE
jgi:hypothetical protein